MFQENKTQRAGKEVSNGRNDLEWDDVTQSSIAMRV